MNDNKLVEIAKEHAISYHEIYTNAERNSLKRLRQPDEPHTDTYITNVKFNDATIQRNDDRDFEWLLEDGYFLDEEEINDKVKEDDVVIILEWEIEESIHHLEGDSIESNKSEIEVYCFVSDAKVIKSIINP